MEKEYLNFNTDDFIADEFFQRWVKFPDKETNDFWNKWILQHPEKRDEITKASAFISNLSFDTYVPDEQNVEASLSRSLSLIEEMESRGAEKQGKIRSIKKYLWVAAAIFTGCIFFTISYFVSDKSKTIEIITGIDEIKSVVLPDSSVITLNGNSSVKYSSNIAHNGIREVWLRGEAFFNVKHIETGKGSRRFVVHSDDLNVEVLGTTFNVKKRKDVYNVSLNTGTIKVYLNDDEGSTISLKSGEFLQYSRAEKYIVKKKVKPELYSDWKDQKMVLDNTPLSEVAELIHDSYGYTTIIKDPKLSDEKISGTILLKDENVFFETLSFALNISIIKKENRLIFQSKNQD